MCVCVHTHNLYVYKHNLRNSTNAALRLYKRMSDILSSHTGTYFIEKLQNMILFIWICFKKYYNGVSFYKRILTL